LIFQRNNSVFIKSNIYFNQHEVLHNGRFRVKSNKTVHLCF